MTEKVYPIIVKMNSKEVHVGSAKVLIKSGTTINRLQREHDVELKEIKIHFKEGDFLTKVLSTW